MQSEDFVSSALILLEKLTNANRYTLERDLLISMESCPQLADDRAYAAQVGQRRAQSNLSGVCTEWVKAQVDCSRSGRQTPASSRGAFERLGADAAQMAVAAGSVVERLDVVEDIGAR